MRTALATAASVVLLCTLAGGAAADLEMGIGNRTVVLGEFAPADEVETARVRIPSGARLTVVVKGLRRTRKETAPVPSFHVEDANGARVAEGLTKGTKATLRRFTVPASDTYRIVVTGDGVNPGLYRLTVKWRTPSKAKEDLDLDAGERTVRISADAGTLADFAAKSARRSAARPRLVEVTADAGGFTHVFPPAGDASARAHRERRVLLPTAGDYTVRIANAAVEPGPAALAVKLRGPKLRTVRALATADVLPPPPQGVDPDVIAGIVGPDGGGFASDDGDAVPAILDGAGLQIPQGALLLPVAFFVRPDLDIDPSDEALEPKGPALFFGPDGFRFEDDVIVTLPFDRDAFGDDLSGLIVFERDGAGGVTEIPQQLYTIVEGAPSTVSFPVRHFTTYQAFGPTGPQQLLFDDFEQGLGDWNVTNGIWQLGTPTTGGAPVSGTNVFATNLTGDYPDSVNSSIERGPITLPAIGPNEALELRYHHWFSYDALDTGIIAIREDVLPPVWIDLSGKRNTSGGWTQGMEDLSAWAGRDVRIAFGLRQAPAGTDLGTYLDDVSILLREDVDLATLGAYGQGFEAGYDGWWASNGLWQIGEPTSGPGAANTGSGVAGTVLDGNYPDVTESALVSPPIRLPALAAGEDLRLTYWHWYALDNLDSLTFEVSERTAPGVWSSWTVLANHSGSSGGWTRTLLDVSTQAGRTVRFNFRLTQAPAGPGPGWYVDDFLLEHRKP